MTLKATLRISGTGEVMLFKADVKESGADMILSKPLRNTFRQYIADNALEIESVYISISVRKKPTVLQPRKAGRPRKKP